MKRILLAQLSKWKEIPGRKPLILQGARQVGKTYLLKEFGKQFFEKTHSFNFEEDPKLKTIFAGTLNPEAIIANLSIHAGAKIESQHLMIWDEIQACPEALTSLKYFAEQAPDYHLVSAGSLLGLTLSPASFPVGKVDFLTLYPINFEEFLIAHDLPLLYEAYLAGIKNQSLAESVHNQLWALYQKYCFVGGLPEVVQNYFSHQQDQHTMVESVRKLQENLSKSYLNDFAKHSGKINAMHIIGVQESIAQQLGRSQDASVSRFRFRDAIPGKKSYAQLQGPIDWLETAHLAIKVPIANKAEKPVTAFTQPNLFKLYYFDVGLLGQKLGLHWQDFQQQDFGQSKGFFAENFVAQELQASASPCISWQEGQSEIEFLLQNEQIIPVEVKSGLRTKAKSLNQYLEKYRPLIAFKLSARPPAFASQKVVQNLPLYWAGKLQELRCPVTSA